MNKKLINEDIQNIKYLFSYKPGRVISEQVTEMTEDKDDLFLRRRSSTLKNLSKNILMKLRKKKYYLVMNMSLLIILFLGLFKI